MAQVKNFAYNGGVKEVGMVRRWLVALWLVLWPPVPRHPLHTRTFDRSGHLVRLHGAPVHF